jgi:hypothetical protein
MTKAGTPPKLKGEDLTTLCGIIQTASARGSITMLRFIIKRMIIRNQEAWNALKEYVKTFNIRDFPGKNVPTACLKLKAVVAVLGDKLPSNAVQRILKGFAHASMESFTAVCKSKIAMCSDTIYASLLAKTPLCTQINTTLDNFEQNYQQLITEKKWEGVGHVGMDAHNKSSFSATVAQEDDNESCFAAYLKRKPRVTFEEWAKLQTCNHCGVNSHIRPQCKKFLADKASGKVPSPTIDKCSPAPSDCCKNIHRDKFNEDPKLKALLSAFAAFMASYVADNYIEDDIENTIQDDNNANTKNKDDDDNDVNAFLGMFGSLKE